MWRRLISLLVLLVPVLGSIGWLRTVDWDARVSTSVMALIPERAPNPELGLARSMLSTVYADRVSVLLRGVSDSAAVDTYIARLKESPLIAEVVDTSGAGGFSAIGAFVFEHRFSLLFARWLEQARADTGGTDPGALAEYAVQQLEAALNRPDFHVFEALIPADPLLLVPRVAERFAAMDDDAPQLPEGQYLLTVKLAVSALSREGQKPVFDQLAEALAAARAHAPEMTAVDSGANRYAAETERNMRKEVRWLNTATFFAVLALSILLCRRVVLVVHVFTMLILSLVITVAVMTALFERVNVFALVFGCVLCGVVVDYGLHAYLHRAAVGRRSLKIFLKPFLISSGSTLAGFMILVFSELPVLRQMGAFVACGLAVAMIVTLVYVFGLLRPLAVTPPRILGRTRRVPSVWLLPLAGAFSLIVLPFITWEDDIRSLKYPLPELEAEEAEIRELEAPEREIYITVGRSFADARDHLQTLNEWLQASAGPETVSLSGAAWVPTREDFLAAQAFAAEHPEFGTEVLAALDAGGYEASAFGAFREDWEAYASGGQAAGLTGDYEALVAAFAEALTGRFSGLVGSNDGLYWWVSLVDTELAPGRPPAEIPSLRLDQVESLSAVLAGYRSRTLQLSLWAGAVIFLILLVVFKGRDALLISSVPVAAVCTAAAGLFLVSGSLGMFHLVGMFLGVCLVLDYSVFTWIGCRETGRMPFSVVVSAATTGASFFILSFSNIPSIQSLGIAVFAVTLSGFILNGSFIPAVAERSGSDG